MKKSALLSLPVMLALSATPAIPQTNAHHYPDAAGVSGSPAHGQIIADTPSRRLDLAQLQRDADDLARTAQTIPTDVASVRKGMLPKDVIDKLKQIEKLSKRLRTELNP